MAPLSLPQAAKIAMYMDKFWYPAQNHRARNPSGCTKKMDPGPAVDQSTACVTHFLE